MPPRKSNASQVSVTVDESANPAAAAAGAGKEGAKETGKEVGKDTPAKDANVVTGINIEDLNLPKSIVTRLAKGVLPPNTQIQGNAMLAMTKSATVFASYLASVANEHALSQSRKTVTAEHVLSALSEIEFDAFRPRLEAELAKYNELQSEKRSNYKANKEKNKKVDGEGEGEGGDDDTLPDDEMERDDGGAHGQPKAKKARLEVDRRTGKGASARAKDGDRTEDEEGEGEVEGDTIDADETEEEQGDEHENDREEELERIDVEEKDEALDNGDDSD